MKKILFVMLGCIVAAASYAAELAQSAPQGGAATIVTKDIDIGEVDKGKMFDYNIEVKNTGKEDLIIENVYSSCGCMEVTDKRWPNIPGNASIAATQNGNVAAELALPKGKVNFAATSIVLKPNQNTYISVKLDTNKVSGQFEKILHVISNDPENKDAMWKIKGVVKDVAAASYAATSAAQNAIMVMVFYSPGCNECKEIMEGYLPKIKEKYGDKIAIINYNIDNPESFAFLLDLQNKYDERAKKGGFFNPKPPAVFVNDKLLYGMKEIKEKLEESIK